MEVDFCFIYSYSYTVLILHVDERSQFDKYSSKYTIFIFLSHFSNWPFQGFLVGKSKSSVVWKMDGKCASPSHLVKLMESTGLALELVPISGLGIRPRGNTALVL